MKENPKTKKLSLKVPEKDSNSLEDLSQTSTVDSLECRFFANVALQESINYARNHPNQRAPRRVAR